MRRCGVCASPSLHLVIATLKAAAAGCTMETVPPLTVGKDPCQAGFSPWNAFMLLEVRSRASTDSLWASSFRAGRARGSHAGLACEFVHTTV